MRRGGESEERRGERRRERTWRAFTISSGARSTARRERQQRDGVAPRPKLLLRALSRSRGGPRRPLHPHAAQLDRPHASRVSAARRRPDGGLHPTRQLSDAPAPAAISACAAASTASATASRASGGRRRARSAATSAPPRRPGTNPLTGNPPNSAKSASASATATRRCRRRCRATRGRSTSTPSRAPTRTRTASTRGARPAARPSSTRAASRAASTGIRASADLGLLQHVDRRQGRPRLGGAAADAGGAAADVGRGNVRRGGVGRALQPRRRLLVPPLPGERAAHLVLPEDAAQV